MESAIVILVVTSILLVLWRLIGDLPEGPGDSVAVREHEIVKQQSLYGSSSEAWILPDLPDVG